MEENQLVKSSFGWKPILFTALVLFAGAGFYYVSRILSAGVETISVVDSALGEPIEGNFLISKPAPEFSLPLLEGTIVNLVDNFGKKNTIVVFWTVWSSGSSDQLRILNDFSAYSPEADIFAVEIQGNKNDVSDFVRRNNYGKIKILTDENGEIGELYGVSTVPAAYFVDSGGIIRDVYVGVLNKDMLETKIEELISH